MRKFDKVTLGLSTATLAVLASVPAMAGAPGGSLPAPGIMGLVAGGVIAAVAVARLRR